MRFLKTHLTLAVVLGLLGAVALFYTKSHGSIVARKMFSEKLIADVTPRDSQTFDEAILDTAVDLIGGHSSDVVLAKSFSFTHAKREIVYKLATSKPCEAKLMVFFRSDSKKEERRFGPEVCVSDGREIRCTFIAPDWATSMDAMAVLKEKQ